MRMKLHHDTLGGDYELYQIYELGDISTFSVLSGYTLEQSSDNVTPNANKYRQFRVINNTLRNHTPKMPITTQDSNSILKANLRYNRVVNNVYMYDEQTMNTFSGVEQGVKPEDWSGNPHYLRLRQDSQGFNNSPYGGYSSVNVIVPVFENSNRDEWSSSYTYYYDDGEKFLKRFVTDSGYTFTAMVSGYYNSNRWRTNCYNIAGFNYYSGYDYYRMKYNYTRDDNSVINNNYNINRAYGITGNWAVDGDYDFNAWGNAPNCVLIFVHFTDSGDDFYGIGIVQYDNYTENCIPIAIDISAYDAQWWGTSIISGGEEGQGNWGNIVVPAGGNGTFDSTSDDYGDSDGVTVTTAVSHINQTTGSGIGDLFNGNGAVNLYMLRTYDRTTNMVANVYKALFSKNFIDAWKVNTLSPMSAVLSTHFIPHEFVSQTFGNSEIVVGGYNLSDWIVEHTTLSTAIVPLAKPVGEIFLGKFDFGKYFGAFPDFAPYTQIFLHIPFVGKVEINVNAVQHGTLSVSMTCDIASGNVCAWIHCTDRENKKEYVHTATGNCAYSFPLFALNQDGSGVGRLISGSMSTMASLGTLLGGIATGNPAIAITGGIGLATSMPNTVNAAMDTLHPKSNVEISGVLGGNNSMIAPTTCWIEIIRPEWIQNKYYQKLHGIPSQLSNTIADSGSGVPFSGYLEIESIDLDGVDCTDSERSEIERLLKAGVYIRGEEI